MSPAPSNFGEQIVTKGGLPRDLEERLAAIDREYADPRQRARVGTPAIRRRFPNPRASP